MISGVSGFCKEPSLKLEPCAGKLACTVLRGLGGGNVTLLPDAEPALTLKKMDRIVMMVSNDKAQWLLSSESEFMSQIKNGGSEN